VTGRRTVPGADDLLTDPGGDPAVDGSRRLTSVGGPSPRRAAAPRASSGRERHDERITVYVSVDELLELERARLALRADHGVAVDRGRIVREALAIVLADLDAAGEGSMLVRRLRTG
jgi:hypothetical protein